MSASVAYKDGEQELLLGLVQSEIVVQEVIEHPSERPGAQAQCRRRV